MLIDRRPREDTVARGHLRDARIDPILRQLDQLLDDDALSQMVLDDVSHRRPRTLAFGQLSTPGETRTWTTGAFRRPKTRWTKAWCCAGSTSCTGARPPKTPR